MKKLLFLWILVGGLIFGVKQVWAVDLVLTRVGSTSVVGTPSGTYSVVGISPEIAGTATPSSTVKVTVNALSATVSAAVSGVWVFTPTNIVTGINTVSVVNSLNTIAFYLSYTPATPTATVTITTMPEITTGELPGSGSWEKPLFLVLLGVGVLLAGERVKEKIEDKWNI